MAYFSRPEIWSLFSREERPTSVTPLHDLLELAIEIVLRRRRLAAAANKSHSRYRDYAE
jgi:hypothetical protein